jgi:hypothetical protein
VQDSDNKHIFNFIKRNGKSLAYFAREQRTEVDRKDRRGYKKTGEDIAGGEDISGQETI